MKYRDFATSRLRLRLTGLALSLTAIAVLSGWSLEIPTPADELLRHAKYLASAELTGRGVDTPGIKLAADYIAAEFARYGLRPGGDGTSFRQGFDVAVGVTVKQPSNLTLGNQPALALGEDWTPLGFSAPGRASGQLVFAGYGITARDYDYDDYAGIDVRGKIVVVLRFEPPPKNHRSPFRKAPDYSRYSTLRSKANNAREHGAAAMILVDLNSNGEEKAELLTLSGSFSRGGASLVAAQVKRSVSDKWLSSLGVSLAALKEKIDRDEKPASMLISHAMATLEISLEEERRRAENVVGILPGADPALKDQYIVIGAHYDHLGFGHFGSANASAAGEIHHGADDNASGVAVLLDLARRLGQSPAKPARSVVFAAFSAEELGLYGSRHFVERFDSMAATKAMLNLDMVGRMRDEKLTVFGARSGENLSAMVQGSARDLGLEIRESDNVGRSDHMSFYNKKIPVMHFSTGVHQDYHRPGDTWDKLNVEGMTRISVLALAISLKIANAKEPVNFVSLPSRSPSAPLDPQRGIGTYLGTMPDYGFDFEGVRIAGVAPNSPAFVAGLQEGDVIVQLADQKIQNIEDLTAALEARSAGDEVTVLVLRKGNSMTLKATLRSRS
ncbi:MAG TPA: M20/M25/M40 family metallo-hydrolase [Candidatus Binatia bacterium]|nr:M20/M25/M40 family metallo-hydrolase [Candidatus Binatia bacterium]